MDEKEDGASKRQGEGTVDLAVGGVDKCAKNENDGEEVGLLADGETGA